MLRKPSVLGLKTIILLCTSYMTLYNIDINQNVNFICYEIQYNTKNCCHIYSLLPYFGFPHSKNAYWTKQFTWKPWLLALHSEACNCVLEKLSLKLENDCSSHCVQPIVKHWVTVWRVCNCTWRTNFINMKLICYERTVKKIFLFALICLVTLFSLSTFTTVGKPSASGYSLFACWNGVKLFLWLTTPCLNYIWMLNFVL